MELLKNNLIQPERSWFYLKKQQIKHLLHAKNEKAKFEKHKKTIKKLHQLVDEDKLHESKIVLMINNHVNKSNHEILNQSRHQIIDHLMNSKPANNYYSRLAMMDSAEDGMLDLVGIVADIDLTPGHTPALLLEKPTAMKTARKLDDHIWLYMNRIIGRQPSAMANQRIAIGDYIRIIAEVESYKGRTNAHLKGFRYGIGSCLIIACGQFVHNKSGVHIDSSYPRGHDWIVKFNDLPIVDPDKSQHVHYITQPSAYPSFKERLHINGPENEEPKRKAKKLHIPPAVTKANYHKFY